MHTGAIVDFYDDPQGTVLKEKVAQAALPDYVKEAQYLGETERDRLPDDVFALIMLDQGEKLRKYACVDPGNTALSTIYFLENCHKLPEEAQKTAAANLAIACGWHDLDIPRALKKTAEADAGTAFNPYVDVTGKEAPARFEKIAYQRFCLIKEGEAKFPIDSYGQVEQAEQWFNDYNTTLHPVERREYCIKLAARAEELGHQINDKIKKYASETYAPDGELKVGVSTRMQYWAEDAPERNMLTGLMSKYASVPPDVFCEALKDFDEVTGLDQHWDDGVLDPYFTTYGFVKQADKVWTSGNDQVTSEQLKCCANECQVALKKSFGDDMAVAFRKNPQQIFDSLPLDTKRIISRMANDNQ